MKKNIGSEIEELIRDNGEYDEKFACGLSDKLVIYPKQLSQAILSLLRDRVGKMKKEEMRGYFDEGYNQALDNLLKELGE